MGECDESLTLVNIEDEKMRNLIDKSSIWTNMFHCSSSVVLFFLSFTF